MTILGGTVYRGHVLRVQTEGPGVTVHVRPSESPFALDDPMPYDLDEKAAMTKAELRVDASIENGLLPPFNKSAREVKCTNSAQRITASRSSSMRCPLR
jgi:hypothetical protein